MCKTHIFGVVVISFFFKTNVICFGSLTEKMALNIILIFVPFFLGYHFKNNQGVHSFLKPIAELINVT